MADPQNHEAPELLPEREESRSMTMLSNALAIIGFIILIVIVVWGLVHIASLSTSSFGSLFSSSPKVVVTAPKNGTSGQPVALSWKYTGKETGSFAFLYQCQQNFQFITSTSASSKTMTKIPCGAAINVGSSTAATVIPASSASTTVSVPVSILFVSTDGKTHAEGSATIAIAPGTVPVVTPVTPEKPTTPTKKPTTTSKPVYYPRRAVSLVPHASSGAADLSIRTITVGVIDPASGALINRAPISPLEIMGIEFDIANIGGSSTGSWYFTANLPTGPSNSYPYTSPVQVSLAPGEHIVNTLRFSPNMRPGVITVTVDPANRVIETNKTNNLISQSI